MISITLFSQEAKDCSTAVTLCGDSPFVIQTTPGFGESDELGGTCLQFESTSYWIQINPITDGQLVFEITPATEQIDYDFLVYKITYNDCASTEIVRCMASGQTGGLSDAQNAPCLGSTGLAFGETDVEELPGCNDGSNNFLAPLEVLSGETYLIMINEFSQLDMPFELNFGGSAILDCIMTGNKDLTVNDVSPLFNITQSSSALQLNTHDFEGNGELTIYTMTGAIISKQSVKPNDFYEIKLHSLTGVYIIGLNTKNQVQSEKVFFVR